MERKLCFGTMEWKLCFGNRETENMFRQPCFGNHGTETMFWQPCFRNHGTETILQKLCRFCNHVSETMLPKRCLRNHEEETTLSESIHITWEMNCRPLNPMIKILRLEKWLGIVIRTLGKSKLWNEEWEGLKNDLEPWWELLENQSCEMSNAIACRALGGGFKNDSESW